MKIPKILFGTGKDVHPRVSRLMTKVEKSGKWPEFSDSDYVDTLEMKNPPRILFHMDPAFGGEPFFRLYSFARYSKEDLRSENYLAQRQVFFDGLANSPWGILALLCETAYVPKLSQDKVRATLFFQNLTLFWDIYIAEKALFFDEEKGFISGQFFWKNTETQLWPLMYKAGVPQEIFDEIEWTKLGDYQARDWIVEYILKANQ